MSYSFLAEAEREYLEAVRFYEDQRAGLGARLIGEFNSNRRGAAARVQEGSGRRHSPH